MTLLYSLGTASSYLVIWPQKNLPSMKVPHYVYTPPILSSLWYSIFYFLSSLKFQKNFLFLRDLSSLEHLLMAWKTELVRASGTVSKFSVRRTHSLNHSLFHLPTLSWDWNFNIPFYIMKSQSQWNYERNCKYFCISSYKHTQKDVLLFFLSNF